MASMYPSQTYQDLIQSYDLKDVRSFGLKQVRASPLSILTTIQKPMFTLFHHMVSVAGMENILGSVQFQGTLLLPTDDMILLKSNLTKDMFLNMDRNTARTLVNYHIFPQVKNLKSLTTRLFSKLDTRHPQSEITVETDRGLVILNGRAIVLSEEFKDNGTILLIDNLLIPPELYSPNYILDF